MLFTDEITPEMRALPQKRFIIMAFLDCLGTFLTAMGAVYTPGQYQTLLNQSLIPCTMIASAVFLRSKFYWPQVSGAFIILTGAFLVLSPSFFGDAPPVETRWYANLLYFASNIPMALSAVYKEYAFSDGSNVHVLLLTQTVSIYQFLFGFVLAPLQMVPGVGTAHGQSFDDITSSFMGGWYKFMEGNEYTALMIGYCFINFVFNTIGLYLTKHAGAALNSISFSMLLPLTTMSYSLPFLGKNREEIVPSTVAGLAVVLMGFLLYEIDEIRESLGWSMAPSREGSPLLAAGKAKGDGSLKDGDGVGDYMNGSHHGEDDGLCGAGAHHARRKSRAGSEDEGRSSAPQSYQERLVVINLPITYHPKVSNHDANHGPTASHDHGHGHGHGHSDHGHSHRGSDHIHPHVHVAVDGVEGGVQMTSYQVQGSAQGRPKGNSTAV
mmetsp:Transcript_96406/g.274806  ORF Transcript_96406/g.274806 Transcript_96406/m.274806 type:complete len:438 (-) Transcript_96406:248-1561(-)